MKMLVVDVYSGYGEMSVNGFEEMEVGSMFEGAMRVRFDMLSNLMGMYVEDNGEKLWSGDMEELVFSEWSRFSSDWRKLDENVYRVNGGEENIGMLFGEGSKWFDIIKENNGDFSEELDEVWEEWLEMCNDDDGIKKKKVAVMSEDEDEECSDEFLEIVEQFKDLLWNFDKLSLPEQQYLENFAANIREGQV